MTKPDLVSWGIIGLFLVYASIAGMWLLTHAIMCLKRWHAKCPHGMYLRRASIKPCAQCAAQEAERLRNIAREKAEKERRQAETLREWEEQARRRREETAVRIHQISYLRKMDPYQFELFVIETFRRIGWEGEATPPTNDNGIDGYLRRNGATAILQCKRNDENNRVGSPVLQALLGAVHREGAQSGVLVTTSSFTENARSWASAPAAGILVLIDADALLKLVGEAYRGTTELPEYFIQPDAGVQGTIPSVCPKCGKGTRKRNGRYGRFIGCSGYPACTWTMDLSGYTRPGGRRRHWRRRR
jgi:restriction endonuclease Mrr